MKHLLPLIREGTALPLLFALIATGGLYLCTPHDNNGASADFFRLLSDPIAISAVLVALQLVAMRWSGVMLNLLLLICTILFSAMVLAFTLGSNAALTEVVTGALTAENIQLTDEKAGILYWLIPCAWLMVLISAPAKLRASATGSVCYFIWLILTPLLSDNTDIWKDSDNALIQQLSELFSNTSWMNAAVPGLFLLIFAFTFELLCSLFPGKSKEVKLSPAPSFQTKA